MDKIQALLAKMGISQELSAQLCESMQNHLDGYKAKLDESFESRLDAAKKVCVHETEQHKIELARRLQIFCEATVQKIERHVAKQSAARDGEAQVKLAEIYRLLEGIGDETTNKTQTEALKRQVTKLTEERDAAIRKANKQNELSEKVLQRNRQLERQLAIAETNGQPRRRPVATVTEGRAEPAQRLDQGRAINRPQSTRRTLRENTDMRTQPKPHNPVRTEGAPGQHMSPADIAAAIEDGPPA